MSKTVPAPVSNNPRPTTATSGDRARGPLLWANLDKAGRLLRIVGQYPPQIDHEHLHLTIGDSLGQDAVAERGRLASSDRCGYRDRDVRLGTVLGASRGFAARGGPTGGPENRDIAAEIVHSYPGHETINVGVSTDATAPGDTTPRIMRTTEARSHTEIGDHGP